MHEALAVLTAAGRAIVELTEKIEGFTKRSRTRLRSVITRGSSDSSPRHRPGVPASERLRRAQLTRFGAHVAAWRNENAAADNGFKQATAAFRELRMPFWTAVASLEYAEWLRREERGAEAEPLLAEPEPSSRSCGRRPGSSGSRLPGRVRRARQASRA